MNDFKHYVHAVARRLADPANRIRGRSAADAQGVTTQPNYKEACRFCLVGAIHREAPWWSSQVPDTIRYHLKVNGLANLWDNATDAEQDDIVQKLAAYGSE